MESLHGENWFLPPSRLPLPASPRVPPRFSPPAVVVLLNRTGPLSPAALSTELAAVIVPPVPFTARPFTGNVAQLAGTYTGAGRGRPMTVVIAAAPNGGVTVSPNGAPAQPAQWVDGLTFRSGPNEIRFDTRNAAAPVLHVSGGTAHYVLKRQ